MLEEKRATSKIVSSIYESLSCLTASIFPIQTVSEIIVDVLDVNDTPPKFEKDSYSEFLSENVPVGTVIAELRATDADTPANTDLVYLFGKNSEKGKSSPLITAGLMQSMGVNAAPFAIDPKTGIVNVTRPLDISESEQYALTVEAFDGLWKATVSVWPGLRRH